MALKYHVIPVTPFAQNCSVLWCDASRKAAVVDAGGDIERIQAWVDGQGLTVEKLLLTHGHIDHAGGAARLAEKLGVPIEGPQRAESFWLDQLPTQGQMFGFPRSEPLTPQRWLEEGDTVTVGQETLDVIHCPGHTRATWCSIARPPRCWWPATCCSRARSAAPTSPWATTSS
ncbi:hydroxyacylglutathione hydrolase [Chromobacterium violaceum]|uniref:Hydroxyacylglutathione hydrolase n=1 Tax=Chromobacterium violaceum TaxID=536 RepID=A0A3S4LFU1_CHRVL|nr:hydroxyacylglutathione hydrolase [Chromobacterium violaceum]